MWAERGPFNTTEEQSLFYINALKMKNGCRFHTLQSLMVLTSRDKVFGFKRKMHFWKTRVTKKKTWNVSTAAGAPVKKIPASLKSHQKPPGEAAEHTELIFFPFQTSVSMNRFSFPESSDCKKLTWRKKKVRSWSPIHSRWVLLICPEKFWISAKKRISCYS